MIGMQRAARSVEASRRQAVTRSRSTRLTALAVAAAYGFSRPSLPVVRWVHSALRETQVERLVGDEAAEQQVRVVVEPVEELELVEAEQHLY